MVSMDPIRRLYNINEIKPKPRLENRSFLGSTRLGAVKHTVAEYITSSSPYQAVTAELSYATLGITTGVKAAVRSQFTHALLLGTATAAVLFAGGYQMSEAARDFTAQFSAHFGDLTGLAGDIFNFAKLSDFFSLEKVRNAIGHFVTPAALTFLGLSLVAPYVNNNDLVGNKVANLFRRLTPVALFVPLVLLLGEIRPLLHLRLNDQTSFFNADELFRIGYAAGDIVNELFLSPITKGLKHARQNLDLYWIMGTTLLGSLWIAGRKNLSAADPERQPWKTSFWKFWAKFGWTTPLFLMGTLAWLYWRQDSSPYKIGDSWRDSYGNLLYDGVHLALFYSIYNSIGQSLDNRLNRPFPASKGGVAVVTTLARLTYAANTFYQIVRVPLILSLLANYATMWQYGDPRWLPLKLAVTSLTTLATIKFASADLLHAQGSTIGSSLDTEKSLNTLDRALNDQERKRISDRHDILLHLIAPTVDPSPTNLAMAFRLLVNSHPFVEIIYPAESAAISDFNKCREARATIEYLGRIKQLQEEVRSLFYDEYLETLLAPGSLPDNYRRLASALERAGTLVGSDETDGMIARIRALEDESYRRTMSKDKPDQWFNISIEPPPEPYRHNLDEALRLLGGEWRQKAAGLVVRAARNDARLSPDELDSFFNFFIGCYSAAVKLRMRKNDLNDTDRNLIPNKVSNLDKLHTRLNDLLYGSWLLIPTTTGIDKETYELPGRNIMIRNPQRRGYQPVGLIRVEPSEPLQQFVQANKAKFYLSKNGVLVTNGYITPEEEGKLRQHIVSAELDDFIAASRNPDNLAQNSPYVLIDRGEVPDELKTSVSWQPRIDSIENTPDQLPRLTMKMPFLAGRNVTVYPWHSDQAPVPPRHYILRNGQTVPLNRPEEAFGIKNIQVLLAGETKSDLEIAAFQLMHDRWAVKRYNNAYADWIAGKRRQNPQAMAWSDRPQFDVLLGNLSAQGETVEGIDDEEHVWHNLLLLHKLIMVGYDLSLSFTAYRRNSRIFPSRRPEPPARPPERLDAFSSLQELVSLPTPRRKGENNNEH